MRALRIASFGGPDVLDWADAPLPGLGPREVLVEVAFCGVCRHDLLTRAGAFPSIALPVTLGHQVSGRIAAVGPGVSSLAAGARVMTTIYRGCGRCPSCQAGNAAMCQGRRPEFLGEDFDGGYAEYVAVPEEMVVAVPAAVTLAEAAVIVCTLGTAYHALVGRGKLQADETVLVTGASGGVGVHTVELAKALGARVLAVTSAEAKRETVREAGADEVIVAPDLDFAGEAKRLTAGRGPDIVVDVVGSQTLEQSMRAVRSGGRVIVLGNVDGGRAEIAPALLILKEIALLGTKSCSRPELEATLAMITSGAVEVLGVTPVPLADAAEVHRRMEASLTTGRVVLEVSGELVTAPAARA